MSSFTYGGYKVTQRFAWNRSPGLSGAYSGIVPENSLNRSMFVFKRALGQEIFSVLPFVEQKNEQEGLDIVETSFVFSFTSLHDW